MMHTDQCIKEYWKWRCVPECHYYQFDHNKPLSVVYGKHLHGEKPPKGRGGTTFPGQNE